MPGWTSHWLVRLCIAIIIVIILAIIIAALGGASMSLHMGHFHWNIGAT